MRMIRTRGAVIEGKSGSSPMWWHYKGLEARNRICDTEQDGFTA
jgi:hypothetical protein